MRGLVLAAQYGRLLLVLGLVAGFDGEVVERQVVPFHQSPLIVMIRDHAGDVDGQVAV